MKHLQKFTQYFKELIQTYRLFFKSAPLVATFVLLLTPLQAVIPLMAVAAGQKVIDQVTNHSPFMEMIVVWIVATAFQQFLPSLSTMVQGVLTDKLTGFINITLMKKSADLQSISIFDDSKYFDDLQMLRDDASWRPVNLIVFGVSVLQSFLTLAFMLIYLARYNWWLALLLLVVMVPQSISYYRIQQQSFETMVERSKNARYLHYYSGLLLDRRDAKEVRLFNMFPKIIEKYTTLFKQTKRDVNQIRKKQLATSSLFVVLTVGVFGYGFYWFTNSVRTGALEVGVLLMFVSVIGYISTSMARVVEDSSLLYDSLLWIEKYFNFLGYQDDFKNGTQSFPDDFNDINVKNLSFTYPFSDTEVLHNVSFSVKSGEKIAVVGENGSGKSTLVKLLMRFYDPTNGKISVDNYDLKDINIFDLHKNLSATFQDFSRFKLTLKENVITGYSFNKDRVNNVLKAAGLGDLLVNDHLNLNTMLAKDFENGTDLSGGQWQKVALARDLYADGKIEFLDEPTAALDAKSESEIYQRFLKENDKKTIFFVTHRLSAVRFADKVLFLDRGKISGFDTHAKLLQTNPKYKEMYDLQKNAYL
ncbi:ABC transporter ATP-binding protein [Lactobacillus hominis]|uniref:Multidrug ABC superfamily ATP binding cassette transporter, ATPase and permease protein n=1 Tax=Lactobacillus hominis DSM 23910 = CRBIP 24.179 TaxID=1423758 RepID=I7L938_9LACO|nr:ABC transporter ATP-binding protein [Lactobacillus hominis]KRM85454.1 multidrug ABC superfamily ATP binding cassette transporter, ATPase and permease protein [Lactobacillus hominis DSM 23910 = CRBIP 24.179]MCT3347469.1 ABC transporter ATP-binding protein [Lactobacillus hominis]CCI81129.1 Multidrug ABC superfamily ATP binding cassette transporter, ATPase and permease protein [Lactobacillus hominis DSM 23910 = CRBIP 24.179]